MRGIGLQPRMSKLYYSLIKARLCNFAEENDLIADEQNEFRKSKKTLFNVSMYKQRTLVSIQGGH